MLEQTLREAMREDSAALVIAPDLAERVRLRGRRHVARRGFVLAAAAVVLAAAVPLVRSADTPGTGAQANPQAPVVLDGVEFRNLPPGLGTPRADVVSDLVGTGQALTWASGDHQVRVAVYRKNL